MSIKVISLSPTVIQVVLYLQYSVPGKTVVKYVFNYVDLQDFINFYKITKAKTVEIVHLRWKLNQAVEELVYSKGNTWQLEAYGEY